MIHREHKFTYTAVHDLKRQLSLILGFSSSLEEEYTTVTREESPGNEFYSTLPGGA